MLECIEDLRSALERGDTPAMQARLAGCACTLPGSGCSSRAERARCLQGLIRRMNLDSIQARLQRGNISSLG